MGMLFTRGDAIPLGDQESAIWIPKPLEPVILYHTTTQVNAEEILRVGFKDNIGTYMTDREWSGVWLANVPIDAADGIQGESVLRVTLFVNEDEIEKYEWIDSLRGHREFLMPAAFVNQHMRLEIISP
jgi:hypothetical protein